MKSFALLAGTAILATLAFAPAVTHADTVKTEVKVEQKDIPDANKVYFTSFDLNGDGILSKNEVGDRLYKSFDRDGNGLIDNIEWGKRSVITIVPMEKETLKLVDFDDDGRSEVATYSTEQFLQETGLSRFDKDNDGLSPREFVGEYFKQVDTSKNHFIEKKEWQAVYRRVYANKHDNPTLYNK